MMPQAYLTTSLPQKDGSKQATVTLSSACDDGVEMNVVNLYPMVHRQTIVGFGASATDGAAATFLSMTDRCREQFLDAYFGEDGLRYTMARVPMDSCDASTSPYCAMSAKDARFDLRRDRETIMPFLRACEKRLGKPLKLMLSPWSPPAYMKSNGERNHGGKLRPEYAEAWAKYLCRFVQAYQDEGFQVHCMSIQNEPNAVQRWDSCTYTPEEERAFLAEQLHPALEQAGLGKLPVFIWDHNKERAFDRAAAILTGDVRDMAQGIAFHWYTGDHFDAIRLLAGRYPEKQLYFTEGCVEYSHFAREDAWQHAAMYAHDYLGNLAAGAHACIEWNYLVNQQGGPNHVSNWVEAPAMYHADEGQLEFKLSYTYLWHITHSVQEGARCIATTRCTSALDVAAFENPDGEIVAVLFNTDMTSREVNLRMNGKVWPFTLEGGAMATVRLPAMG